MKKTAVMILVLIFTLSSALATLAEDGKVTYRGNAENIFFEPGGKEFLTDLFPDFKDVMPGDTLKQTITVKNDASKEVKVKIYIRFLGTKEGSEDFLSHMNLKVQKSADNKMEYMFDAYANEKGQLDDWVCLGTLYSGGTVNLDVTLTASTEMGNEFMNRVGHLDWEFMVEEFPVEDDDPTSPPTGDEINIGNWIAVASACLFFMVILVIVRKKKDAKEDKKEI